MPLLRRQQRQKSDRAMHRLAVALDSQYLCQSFGVAMPSTSQSSQVLLLQTKVLQMVVTGEKNS